MNLDKLAKSLSELAGYKRQALISKKVFEDSIFSNCKPATEYFWRFYSDNNNDTGGDTISEDAFISHTEQILTSIIDKDQVQLYLRIFASGREQMDKKSFMDFLRSGYILYRTLHKLGNEDDTSLPATLQWLETVYKSAYNIKTEMSVCFLTNWILTNCPCLVVPMHKQIASRLNVSRGHVKSGAKDDSKKSTPPQVECSHDGKDEDPCCKLIHPVLMWLLRSSLPVKFLNVSENKPGGSLAQQIVVKSQEQLMQMEMLADKNPGSEGWTLLYDSDDQGLSVNRFQHHVFNYRGATLMFIKADNDYLFCIASDVEWKESCHFWGGEESVLFMVKPEFRVVERGSKLLYSNFSIRGYPLGIQVGKNPRNLSIEIKPEFTYVSYKQIPCKIIRFLAWGCAPPEVKISQSDLRKWEEKQAEKNRKINLNNPEWKDNPDKYLLELAGSYKSYGNQ